MELSLTNWVGLHYRRLISVDHHFTLQLVGSLSHFSTFITNNILSKIIILLNIYIIRTEKINKFWNIIWISLYFLVDKMCNFIFLAVKCWQKLTPKLSWWKASFVQLCISEDLYLTKLSCNRIIIPLKCM